MVLSVVEGQRLVLPHPCSFVAVLDAMGELRLNFEQIVILNLTITFDLMNT